MARVMIVVSVSRRDRLNALTELGDIHRRGRVATPAVQVLDLTHVRSCLKHADMRVRAGVESFVLNYFAQRSANVLAPTSTRHGERHFAWQHQHLV